MSRAVHRRAGLADLRVEDHANRPRVVVHREDERVVANQRTDDVAVPAAFAVAIRRAAMKPDAGAVDGFLAERAEPLALHAERAVLDLGLQVELFQAVVERAHQHHAAHHFQLLVSSQRCGDRLAGDETVNRVEQLGDRGVPPFFGRSRPGSSRADRRGRCRVIAAGSLSGVPVDLPGSDQPSRSALRRFAGADREAVCSSSTGLGSLSDPTWRRRNGPPPPADFSIARWTAVTAKGNRSTTNAASRAARPVAACDAAERDIISMVA